MRILFNMIARLRKEWAWSADSGDHPVASDQGVNVPMPDDDDSYFEDDDGDETCPIDMPQKKFSGRGLACTMTSALSLKAKPTCS